MNIAPSAQRSFQRSVNIERDADNHFLVEAFITSPTASNVLSDMAEALSRGQSAFTWTGAYGSGKSLLALMLSHLLEGLHNGKGLDLEQKIDADVVQAYGQLFHDEAPRIIRLIAKDDKLEEQIISALFSSYGPSVMSTDDDLEVVLENCSNCRPVVLIVDELGKFFDACARKNSDVFVLQQLAEFANRSGNKLVFLGLLHQAFSQYSSGISAVASSEWSKVQGRFMDIPFNLSLEEQVQLLRSTLQERASNWSDHLSKVEFGKFASSVRGSCPWLSDDKIDDLHPLCPITAVMLGAVSRQAFSQNQRSLFSFLSSNEPFSFYSLIDNEKDEREYRLFDLWDYLNANFELSIVNSFAAKEWYLSIECVQRAEKSCNQLATELVKAVSILQIFGSRHGIRPEVETVRAALNHSSKKNIQKAIQDLLDNKILVFREVGGFFALSDSSDFDLNNEIDQVILDEAPHTYLNSGALKPIVAKRHYIETGSMRWLSVEFVSLDDLISMDETEFAEKAIICLTSTASSSALKSIKSVISNIEVPVAVLLPSNASALTHAIERRAKLAEIARSSLELKVDRVARNEVDVQLGEIEALIKREVENVYFDGKWVVSKFGSKSTGTWQEITGGSIKGLNANVSSLFDAFYPNALIIKNELANRTKLSANASSALKSLMLLCLSAENRERLNIIGTPPELTIFNSFIAKHDLHQFRSDTKSYGFMLDEKSRKQAPISKLWKTTDELVSVSADGIDGQTIFETWRSPPFGVKRGIFPLVLLLYILTNRHRLAVYYEGVYQVEITPITVEWLIKTPSDFKFALVEHDGSEQNLVKVSGWLSRHVGSVVEPTPLGIGRGLKALQKNLPKWALNTRLLSPETLQFRDELKKAHDPIDLVHNKLAMIFGNNLEGLEGSVVELSEAYPKVMDRISKQLFADFRVEDDDAGREEINDRAKSVKKRTGDFDLESFVNQLELFDGSDRAKEDLLMNLIKKDPKTMIDQDIDRATIMLSEKVMAFQKVEAHARYSRRGSRSRAMSLVYAPSENKGVVNVDLRLTSANLKLARTKAKEIKDVLDGLAPVDREIALGAIALYIEDKVADDE